MSEPALPLVPGVALLLPCNGGLSRDVTGVDVRADKATAVDGSAADAAKLAVAWPFSSEDESVEGEPATLSVAVLLGVKKCEARVVGGSAAMACVRGEADGAGEGVGDGAGERLGVVGAAVAGAVVSVLASVEAAMELSSSVALSGVSEAVASTEGLSRVAACAFSLSAAVELPLRVEWSSLSKSSALCSERLRALHRRALLCWQLLGHRDYPLAGALEGWHRCHTANLRLLAG